MALGDSVTVGLGDPMPGGGWRGWARLLADSIGTPGEVELDNLACSGALVRDVLTTQLPRAPALRPTLATVLVGCNDTLRGRFDLAAVAAGLEEIVTRLRDAGVLVLTATLPDPGMMLRIPETVRRPLARRVHAINSVLECVANGRNTVHVDLAGHPALYDRRMWGVDRLHPSERGHRLLARQFAGAFGENGVRLRALPDPEPANPEPTLWESARWMATEGTGWVVRRSRDLLPQLTGLVLGEYWHRLRRRGPALDARLEAELDAVLRRVCAGPVPCALRPPQEVSGDVRPDCGRSPRGCRSTTGLRNT
ncbi:SGNH/GDSL hydrolase family protein [Microtetraspora sp. NBRC 13810]|uniref:SGNH/GDSL hydrolase family protein n=1 Tax=Microtetraspora sp. NBRC 13810 TaxID=3030990 RepID=UPI0025567B99|nr:SGNH/GDSL hydrolase family protein [Microtetraspora sp. NBRC 13810]